MARRLGTRSSGRQECTICRHPGKDEINAMILSGAIYNDIIDSMQRSHPTWALLTKSAISRHRAKHLLNQPITVVDENGEKTTYITGVIRSESLQVPPNAIPQQQVTLDQALDLIITAGTLTILNDPGVVGMKTLMDALILKDKRSGNDTDKQDWEEAWTDPEFQKKKKELSVEVEKKRKLIRRKRVSYEEEVQEDVNDAGQSPIIDVTPEPEPMKQLEVSDGDESADFANYYIPKPTPVPVSRIERGENQSRSTADELLAGTS